MQNFLLLAIDFIKFWFVDAPKGLLDYFYSFNTAFLKLCSFYVLTVTFFKPWKNEYREGLVGFSIIMGMAIKSILLAFDVIIFLILIVMELGIMFLFISWPVITVTLLFL